MDIKLLSILAFVFSMFHIVMKKMGTPLSGIEYAAFVVIIICASLFSGDNNG